MRLPSGYVTSVQEDLSGVGPEKSGDAVKGSGLPGAVRPDEGMNVPAYHLEVDVVYRLDSAKGFGQTANYECVRHGDILIRLKMPTSPRGNAKTTRTKTNPKANCHAWNLVVNSSRTKTKTVAPMIGPSNVPIPPKITMIRTFPDSVQ
jgi:hypothetical protein